MIVTGLANLVVVCAVAAQAAAPVLTTAVTARAVQPGEVLKIEVRSTTPLASAEVKVFGQTIAATRVAADSWRVLVGIDLAAVPGDYPIEVEAKTAAGATAAEREVLTVEAKDFPTRTLTVDPKFVTPPKSARARIEREARTLGAIFRSEGKDRSWLGPFAVPIEGAVVSGFGVRSVYNGEPRSPHGGADFASPTGTPVRAPGPGTVALASDLYFTGGTVVVDHGGGLYSLFAHLSKRTVREGERVSRGDLVGEVGATGRVTGPHLHWTVRLHAARVDPLSLVFATTDASGQTP